MDERDLQAEQAGAGTLVDEICTRDRKLLERGRKIADFVRHVMHSRPTLRQEATDGGVVAERLEQLDPILADADGRCADSLIFNSGAVLDLCTEQLLVCLQGLVEVGHGHAEMVNAARLHARDAIRRAT
jgi:hypothetical protein